MASAPAKSPMDVAQRLVRSSEDVTVAIAATAAPRDLTEDDKDEDGGLYTMDDKSDGEGMLIVEEGGGGVGRVPRPKSRSTSLVPGAPATALPASNKGPAAAHEGDDEEDAEGEEDGDEDAEKDDTYGEWDVYEQEV